MGAINKSVIELHQVITYGEKNISQIDTLWAQRL